MLSSAEAYKRIHNELADIARLLDTVEDNNLRTLVMQSVRNICAIWYERSMGREVAIASQVESLQLLITLLREQESSVHPPDF